MVFRKILRLHNPKFKIPTVWGLNLFLVKNPPLHSFSLKLNCLIENFPEPVEMIDSFFDVLLFPLFLASLALMTFLRLTFEIFRNYLCLSRIFVKKKFLIRKTCSDKSWAQPDFPNSGVSLHQFNHHSVTWKYASKY